MPVQKQNLLFEGIICQLTVYTSSRWSERNALLGYFGLHPACSRKRSTHLHVQDRSSKEQALFRISQFIPNDERTWHLIVSNLHLQNHLWLFFIAKIANRWLYWYTSQLILEKIYARSQSARISQGECRPWTCANS